MSAIIVSPPLQGRGWGWGCVSPSAALLEPPHSNPSPEGAGLRTGVLLAFLLLITLLLPLPAFAQPAGRFVEIAAAPSANITPPHVVIWLPPGYDTSKRRYGVVYMNDGQNVFFPERSGFNKVWAADKAALQVIGAGKVDPFIIVAVDHPGEARYRQYFPQRLYETASLSLQRSFDRLAKGPITGDAYLRFLTAELKPMIDREYRTKRDAAHTAIIGSSMGGLISCYAFVEYPKVFGRAGCVSTHWPLADPADVGPFSQQVADLWKSYLTRRLGPPDGRRLWMDHGTETLDASYAPWQEAIDVDLTGLRWRKGYDFTSRTYQGAAHEENAWAARLPEMFTWLLARRS